MTLWLLLAAAFIVQEPISSSVILLQAYQSHYNLWLITLLFCAITIIEIIIGYYLGRWIEKKFGTHKLIVSVKKRLETFGASIGKYGKIVGLIVFVPIIFPVAAIFIPWFDVSLAEAVAYVLIGELIFWYAYEWLLVFGVHSFVTDSRWALFAILCVSVALTFGIKWLMKRKKGK
jgi:membrane protein YqaA with SNARE-associated domain